MLHRRLSPIGTQSQPVGARNVRARARAGACVLTLGAVLGVAACGTQSNSVPAASVYHEGAELFREHCSGCHSLAVVGAEGSATNVKDRLRNQGPNFNFRHENVENVLFAIRNGGFSGAIMPQNIVVGAEAQQIAAFLAHYAGSKAPKVPSIEITQEEPAHASTEAVTPRSAPAPTYDAPAASTAAASGGAAAPTGHAASRASAHK